ncbi:alpha/beta-hydrolase [Mytilinidion resinicola]|uniref:Alpha/beta-hydrolase n=1 Tax=Mytilinidion resinicola TaxID=574789 RepID=A0A6A6Z3R7_9PEZI|nr:alpha/beta-hydrolase [Mytilinidion resinicola]KAF2814924.1 alpha/beta-hydrolase [Mytilinidion resinicola]
MTTEEGSFTTDDGFKLYTKTWKTAGPAVARLVFIHGFSDHCNTYGGFFPTLASRGIDVYSFDQRGWGRSVHKPAEKGDTGPTSRVLADIDGFIKSVLPSPVPLFLMGHSMGGGEVLCFAANGPAETREHIRGYLLESPFVDFDPKSKPSSITVVLGRLVGKLMPKRQMVNALDWKLVSRDQAVGMRIRDDPLCHDTGTLEGLAGLLDRTGALSSGKIRVGKAAGEGGVTRISIAHGTADGICSFAATKHLASQLEAKDKEFKPYEGYYHRLHDEPKPDGENYINDVGNWILARIDKPVEEAAKPKL